MARKERRMKTKSFLIFACVFVLVISSLSIACRVTPTTISAEIKTTLLHQVRQKPYVAMIEGFQPLSGESMMRLGQKISLTKNMSTCATSGNHDEHMPMIREAYRYHQLVYIAGFSLGEAEAINLAEDCGKEGIPVEKLFLMDGFEKSKIPVGVKDAIDIVGTAPYWFRRSERYTTSDLQNKKTTIRYAKLDCAHLDVPEQSLPVLLSKFP